MLAGLGLRYEREGTAPTAYILDLFPELEDVSVPMGDVRFRWSNMNPMETYCLSAICMVKRPRLVFEIGTFDGATTARLAASSPEVEVVTLDLPTSKARRTSRRRSLANRHSASGFRYRDTPAAVRIRQLFGDSRTFDFGPLVRQGRLGGDRWWSRLRRRPERQLKRGEDACAGWHDRVGRLRTDLAGCCARYR